MRSRRALKIPFLFFINASNDGLGVVGAGGKNGVFPHESESAPSSLGGINLLTQNLLSIASNRFPLIDILGGLVVLLCVLVVSIICRIWSRNHSAAHANLPSSNQRPLFCQRTHFQCFVYNGYDEKEKLEAVGRAANAARFAGLKLGGSTVRYNAALKSYKCVRCGFSLPRRQLGDVEVHARTCGLGENGDGVVPTKTRGWWASFPAAIPLERVAAAPVKQ